MEKIRISDLIAKPFWPVHQDIKNKGHDEYWLMGGRGSAKSSFVSVEIILELIKTPGINAIIYRKVAATLRESVYEQIVWAIDALGLTALFLKRLSPLEIVYRPTGQKIMFRGADDPSKSKSIKLAKGYFGILWFEEASEFQGMEAIRTIKASVIRGTPHAGNAITFYSYNPPISANNWVNKEALREVKGRLKHSSDYRGLPRHWLGEAFITEAEQLRDSNERAYRHMYLGEVTGTGGNVFVNLSLRRITEDDIKTMGNIYSGIDWGWFPDPFHFIRCSYDAAQRRLWIWDEYRTILTSNLDVFQYLVRKKGLNSGEEVIADSSENKSVSDMRSYGMNCVGATKGPRSVRASIKWLQSLKEIIIDPARCPETAMEFSSYEYEQNREGEFVDAFPDKDNHGIDAVRYATNRIWMRAGA